MKKILIYGLVAGGLLLVSIAGILIYLFMQFGSMMSAFNGEIPVETIADVSVNMEMASSTLEAIPLTEGQQAIVETLGIEPEVIPSLLTPELEACATEILGAERIAEIKAGATPSPVEVARVSGCVL